MEGECHSYCEFPPPPLGTANSKDSNFVLTRDPTVIPSGGKWEKWQQLPFQQGATVGRTFVAEESTLHSPHTQKVSGPGSLSPPCLCRCEPPCPVAFLPFLKLSSSSEHCSSPASINLSPKKTANNDVFLHGLPIAFIA